ncbi:MAG: ABC transporter permease [Rhodanobacter sp.]
MHMSPIFSALRRHKIPVVLIAAQIGLTLAVFCNATYLLSDAVATVSIHSGVDDGKLGLVKIIACDACQVNDINVRALNFLRQIDGISAVAVVNTVPFSSRQADFGIRLDQSSTHETASAHFYAVGPDAPKVLGLELTTGRQFTADDFQPATGALPNNANVWVTQALASTLWPGQTALGKDFWVNKWHFTVIGTLRYLVRPEFELQPRFKADWSVVVPMQPGGSLYGTYVFRAAPKKLPTIINMARNNLSRIIPGIIVDDDETRTISTLRTEYFKGDMSMISILAAIVGATLLTTVLGIVGLTSFWVSRRRRQIGVRRALGATRFEILKYFLIENAFIVSLGSLVGVASAYALNLGLMQIYELPRLPFLYIPLGVLLMLFVGQTAALGPAIRASSIAPAEAIRVI